MAGNEAREFLTTSWTLIRAAAAAESPNRPEALQKFFNAYWQPLYLFIRRLGYNHHQAEDLVQGFCSKVIEKNYLDSADPARGRFRSFLICAVKRYVAKEATKGAAIKRGGGVEHAHLDIELAERLFQSTLDRPDLTPEIVFDRAWTINLLNQAVASMEKDYRQNQRFRLFGFLKTTLPGFEPIMTYPEAALYFGRPVNTLKSDVRRFRGRFREVFRDLVAKTVRDRENLDEEIRYLIRTLM